MSIASAITAAQGRVNDAYDAVASKGGTIPATRNLSNLPTAINSITSSGYTQIPSYEVNSNGIAVGITAVLDGTEFNDIVGIAANAMNHVYYSKTVSGPVKFPSLVTITGDSACASAFSASGVTSVNMSALTTVSGYQGCYFMFNSCSSIVSVDLSSLQEVSGSYACHNMFGWCTGITSINLSSLKTISGSNGMDSTFNHCTHLTSVDLSSLETISGASALYQAFANTALTSLSFPSLKSTSFGDKTNQFSRMLADVTGCTVHFPSNLQSVIGSWSSVTGGFGGTNTTVLFDLPATE